MSLLDWATYFYCEISKIGQIFALILFSIVLFVSVIHAGALLNGTVHSHSL